MEKNPSSDGMLDPIKDATLKYSGYAYLLGDAAMFAYGLTKREYGTAFTGLSWGAGGLALALYGKQEPEYQLKRLTQDLGRYLTEKGYHLPQGSEISQETLRSHQLWQGVERFLYDHPSEILNTVYAIGSTTLLHSGRKKGDYWQAASGALVGAGALGGLLIPEKEAKPDEKDISPLADPIGWVAQKPLRVPSLLYTLNNVTLAKSGFDEMRANPANKAYLYKYLTVGSYVIANALLGLSHKDRDNENSDLPIEKLEHAAAEAIAAQPPELQKAILKDTAQFLSSRKQITLTAAELESQLQTKVAELSQRSKVQQASLQGRLDESRTRSMSNV